MDASLGVGLGHALQRQRAAEHRSCLISSTQEHFLQEEDIGRHIVHDQDLWRVLLCVFRHDMPLSVASRASISTSMNSLTLIGLII